MTLHHGDCLEVMAAMESESVDAIVTDPPYGLEFMGKEWDRLQTSGRAWRRRVKESSDDPEKDWGVFNRTSARAPHSFVAGHEGQAWHEAWAREALRVAKPSAYLLAFGGTRTVHRLVAGIEDAGWIIRDMLVWAYASGFPKSKASLKPAWEPIVMARKPGPLRMLDIDGCRIGPPLTPEEVARSGGEMGVSDGRGIYGEGARRPANGEASGRWPANVILTDPIFDGGVEGVVGGGYQETHAGTYQHDSQGGWFGANPPAGTTVSEGDSGTYSRFFLIPKADRADREPVLGGLALPPDEYEHSGPRGHSLNGDGTPRPPSRQRANVHPTVKPVDLMRHLVRLVTPAGGIVLDPFLGSGTTAIAAEMEGFGWVGIEREAEYVAIAEARLNGVQKGLGLVG